MNLDKYKDSIQEQANTFVDRNFRTIEQIVADKIKMQEELKMGDKVKIRTLSSHQEGNIVMLSDDYFLLETEDAVQIHLYLLVTDWERIS